ncbi:hypothetical protein G7Z17_g4467 [Cylindrodendrum hubeiense]|uniref:Uncharacterized protein n=1 Tax=Cylindrodendrum hubeiense TaxID=595255 RepID=A0A9P5HCS1_9HYPO|nr:hypothetical protein G7Z17_g4467 [Cylindrodendrum hubeiense]
MLQLRPTSSSKPKHHEEQCLQLQLDLPLRNRHASGVRPPHHRADHGWERPEYQMTQIDTWGMSGNIDTFRRGATAFRNARDLAQRHRDNFIEAANARASLAETAAAQENLVTTTETQHEEDSTSDEFVDCVGYVASQDVRDANTDDFATAPDSNEALAPPHYLHPDDDSQDPSQASVTLDIDDPSMSFTTSFTSSFNSPRILEIEEDKDGTLQMENHRVVGCGGQQVGGNSTKGSITNSTSQQDIRLTRYKTRNDLDKDEDYRLFATESYSSFKLLYAQDMFSAFMWAVAKTLPDPIKGRSNIRLDDSSSVDTWQNFTLRNDQLSNMVQDIHTTGLGTLDQVYLSIIPPLSAEKKLPEIDKIVELAREHAKPHERVQHWKQAGDVYLWLFSIAKTFPEESHIAKKVTAILVEYLRTIILTVKLREAQQYKKRDIVAMKKVKSDLEEELKGGQVILGLYKEQGREWKCDIVRDAGSAGEGDTSSLATFNFTRLHELAQSKSRTVGRDIQKALLGGEKVNQMDIHYWTPLHYAAAKGSAEAAEHLLKHQADVNARDLLNWSPLHYACKSGTTLTVQNLLREGAELDVRGTDGVAPLHRAAMNGYSEGHKEVVDYLWKDANKKLRDNNGRTALHLAATAGKEEVVRWLIKEPEADKEAKDRYSQTPLHLAAAGGHIETMRALVKELEANNEARDKDGRTPLHYATGGGHTETVRALVKELKANKEAKDGDGRTPLHEAVRCGHTETVRVLVKELEVDKEAKDGDGRTPLHYDASDEIARLLG